MQRSVLALVMCISRSVLCSSHDAISVARCRSREPEESLRVELQPAPSRSHHIPHLVNNRYKIMLARGHGASGRPIVSGKCTGMTCFT